MTGPTSSTRKPGPPRLLRDGLGGVVRGGLFLGRHRGLVRWVVLPLLVNVLLAVALVASALAMADGWAPAWSDPWWWGFDWLRPVAAWTAGALLDLLAVAAGLLVALALSGVVNSPFYDVLSERTEDLALGRAAPPRPWSTFLDDTVRSLGASLALLLRQGLVLVPLFLFSFTAVGAPVFAVAGFYYSGLGLVDPVLARRRLSGAQRARWGRRRFLLMALLGLPVALVPPLAPLGVVGGTLTYLDDPGKDP